MPSLPYLNPERTRLLLNAVAERILILDGAMGTMLQTYALGEPEFRGKRFPIPDGQHQHGSHTQAGQREIHHCDLKGNNDLLTLTQPHIIREIHRQYLDAGADLIETNTFNSTAISQADYQLESLVYELNREGARLARLECDAASMRNPTQPRFVVGVLGPTSRTASMSPDVNQPGFRNIDFDELVAVYTEASNGLIDGGSDVLMVETIFDTLNAKAALYAIAEVFEQRGARLPIMISGTITDKSGRTLSGQTAEAFWFSLRHANPLSIGLNCALGARDLREHIEVLSQIADCYVSAHPNAGLPNVFGGYDESPEETRSGEITCSKAANVSCTRTSTASQ